MDGYGWIWGIENERFMVMGSEHGQKGGEANEGQRESKAGRQAGGTHHWSEKEKEESGPVLSCPTRQTDRQQTLGARPYPPSSDSERAREPPKKKRRSQLVPPTLELADESTKLRHAPRGKWEERGMIGRGKEKKEKKKSGWEVGGRDPAERDLGGGRG